MAWRKERSFPRSFRRRTPIYVLKVSLTNLKGLMTVDVCVTCNKDFDDDSRIDRLETDIKVL